MMLDSISGVPSMVVLEQRISLVKDVYPGMVVWTIPEFLLTFAAAKWLCSCDLEVQSITLIAFSE